MAVILDFVFFNVSLILAEKIYHPIHWEGFPEFVKPWIYIVPALLQIFISSSAGAYKKNALSVLSIIISAILGVVILSSLTFFFKQYAFSRAIVLITYSLFVILSAFWRFLLKAGFKVGLSSEVRRARTLVVGTTSKASELALKLRSSYTNIHHILGLISLSRKEIGSKVNNFQVLGSLNNLNKIITEKKVHKVIFSSDEISSGQMFSVVSLCQGENVEFMVAGSKLDYLVGKSTITMLDDIPLLKIHYNISAFTHTITKALFDRLLSFMILLFVFPFIYLIHRAAGKENDFIRFVLSVPGVLMGRKSFVGPRINSYYSDLYLGKTGLTGLWYTDSFDQFDEEEENKLNIFYARNQNIWLDLEILGKSLSKNFIKAE